MNEQDLREAQAQEAEAQKAREAEEAREAAAASLETERVNLRSDWISRGGTSSEFDSSWPALKKQMLTNRVIGAYEESQRAARDTVRNMWGGA